MIVTCYGPYFSSAREIMTSKSSMTSLDLGRHLFKHQLVLVYITYLTSRIEYRATYYLSTFGFVDITIPRAAMTVVGIRPMTQEGTKDDDEVDNNEYDAVRLLDC